MKQTTEGTFFEDNEKVTMFIVGRPLPSVVDGPVTMGQKTLPNGRVIPAQFAWLISLRETNPDGDNPGIQYRARTLEDIGFTVSRDPRIVVAGLDVDAETGEILSRERLEEMRGQDIAARQLVNQTRNAPVVVPL
jgi:hypothetical protein